MNIYEQTAWTLFIIDISWKDGVTKEQVRAELNKTRAVLSQGGPRDAVVNFFIEIYSGIARSSLR